MAVKQKPTSKPASTKSQVEVMVERISRISNEDQRSRIRQIRAMSPKEIRQMQIDERRQRAAEAVQRISQ